MTELVPEFGGGDDAAVQCNVPNLIGLHDDGATVADRDDDQPDLSGFAWGADIGGSAPAECDVEGLHGGER